jgi:hypothetical protein
MSRVTLRERFCPLRRSDDVDRFLERFAWSVVFKAGRLEPLKARAARMLDRLAER